MESPSDSRDAAALRRRRLLAVGGGSALTLALAACGSEEGGGNEEPEGGGGSDADAEGLVRLLELERRSVRIYEEGARFSDRELERTMRALADQSLAHVRALEPLVRAAGGTVPPVDELADPPFVRDSDSAVRAAIGEGRKLLRTYVETIGGLGSPSVRRELLPMLANDAQHLVVLGGAPASSAAPGLPDA